MSSAIKEQGPKTYAVMRARLDAAAASEGPTTHHRGLDVAPALVSAEQPRATADVLAALTGSENKRASDVEASLHRGASGMPVGVVQALTGKPADATLPAETLPLVNPLGVMCGPTADVENDGDRGPLPLADLARSSAVASLVAACGPLDVRTVRLLVWIAEQLPADKLRASCEEATATGWCRSDATDPTARRTRVDAARSALLGAVREIEGLLVGDKERTPRRVREEVLADEIERRATGGVR